LKPKIDIQVRDILQSGADIVVFSAHPSLLAGSGVSGVVHKAAGPELEIVFKGQKLTNSLNGYEN
jgi:O-acetyl-ADP-ribose deacetylase (regulator of RNase III)